MEIAKKATPKHNGAARGMTISIRVSKDLANNIDRLAEKETRTRSAMATILMSEAVLLRNG